MAPCHATHRPQDERRPLGQWVRSHAPRWLVRYARIGYVAKGTIYLGVGGLALAAALGAGGALTDAAGLLGRLARTGGGRWALLVIALGLIGHSGLRLVQGLLDPERRGAGLLRRVFRAGEVATGVGYGLMAMGAIQLARGRPGPKTSDRATAQLSHELLAMPNGDALLVAVGLVVIAFGLSMLARGLLVKNVCQELDLQQVPRLGCRTIAVLIRVGLLVQSLLFGLVGSFLVRAGWDRAPGQARGMPGALRHLASQPQGSWLLTGVAVGLIALALACFADARWRRFAFPASAPHGREPG
jgi:hypothetical protein